MSINDLRARELLAETGRKAHGLTDREIARRLGISKARVYQLRLRAVTKIRQAVVADPVLRELAEEVCGVSIASPGDCE